jgi:hypothetical protein
MRIRVDGTSVNGNSRDGITNLTPEPDSVAQMKLSTDTFSADKGRQSGTLIEVFTKPGTNQFHGTLSELYTGSGLTARTEFQTKVPRYIRNDFGGSVGGPIIQDKTFFFGSLFWSKSNQGVTLTQPMETPEFVQYVTQHYPNSMAAAFFKAAPSGGVPTSGFQTVSQIEQALVSPYTPPDIPGDLIAMGNVSINQSPVNNGFQGHVRIDHNFHSGNDKLFYSLFRNTTQGGVASARPNTAYVSPNATWYHKIDYVQTFSATLLNEASMSYVRADGNQPAAPGDLPNLPNAYPGGLGTGFSSWGPSGWVHNNWNWHDVLTYVKNNHSIRVGIDVDRQQDLDNFTAGLDRPTFSFANIVDFAVDHPTVQSGPIVDVQGGGTAQSLYSRVLMLQTAPYVQDDWKATKNLTLNVGLRFDYFGHLGTVTYGPNPLALFTPGSALARKSRSPTVRCRFVAPMDRWWITRSGVSRRVSDSRMTFSATAPHPFTVAGDSITISWATWPTWMAFERIRRSLPIPTSAFTTPAPPLRTFLMKPVPAGPRVLLLRLASSMRLTPMVAWWEHA